MLAAVALYLLGQAVGWLALVYLGWGWGIGCLVVLLLKAFRQVLLWSALGYASVFAALSPSSATDGVSERYLAVVLSTPRYARVGGVSIDLALYPPVRSSPFDDHPIRARCTAPHLPWRHVSTLRRSDVAFVTVDLRPIRKSLSPFSWYRSMSAEGIEAQCKLRWATRSVGKVPGIDSQFADRIRRDIESVVGTTEASGLLLSMAFGFRDTISEDTEKDFRATGLSHLLVLSGFQVTLLFTSLSVLAQVAVRRCLRRGGEVLLPWLPLVTLCVVVLFLIQLGIEDAGSRAVVSVSLALVALWNERGTTFFNTVIASAFLCSVLWPCILFNIGMQLTFAALLGIVVGRVVHSESVFQTFVSVTYATWLFTSLVCLAWFQSFSILGFCANAIVAPVATFVGTQGGLLGWLLLVTGIDPGGYVLARVVEALSTLKEVVHTLSVWSGGVLILEGTRRWLALLVLSMSAVSILLSRVAIWGKSHGFVEVRVLQRKH